MTIDELLNRIEDNVAANADTTKDIDWMSITRANRALLELHISDSESAAWSEVMRLKTKIRDCTCGAVAALREADAAPQGD